MTWFSTWPRNGIPTYAAHETEAAAEQHAHDLVASGTVRVATIFHTNLTDLTVLPDEEQHP